MEEIKKAEQVLEEVTGGAGATVQHVKIVNCKNYINVRSTPDSKNDVNVIGKAYLNDQYRFYSWAGKWATIQYGDRKAYVFTDYVQIV